jgi:hypothetical protein
MSSKSFIVQFRTILRLLGEPVPVKHEDVIKKYSDKIKECNCGLEFDSELFLKILEFRNKPNSAKKVDFEILVQSLIDTTNSMLKYVDKLEV